MRWADLDDEARGGKSNCADWTACGAGRLRLARARGTRKPIRAAAMDGRVFQDVKLVGPDITDESLEILGDVEQLRRLQIEGTSITDVGLKGLHAHPNLAMLYLAGENIGDPGIYNLGVLPSLTVIDLSRTNVTNHVIDALLAFPSLHLVLIDGTSIDREALDEAFESRDRRPPILQTFPGNDG